jgi:c(7)-type cytochrome triheme protein
MLRGKSAQELSPANSRRASGGRFWLSLIVLFMGTVFFGLTLALNSRAGASTVESGLESNGGEGGSSSIAPGMRGDFSKFAHGDQAHARLPCLLCHNRQDASPGPKLPGHVPCAGCHTEQLSNPASPICSICHTNTADGAMKSFPPLKSFNARFDHARHATGPSHPRAGCVACHTNERRGVAFTIPAGQNAHQTCFQCHSPRAQSGSGEDISSCNTCHQLGSFRRASTAAKAFKVGFSHSKHGARQGLSCNSCHQVRAGMPQGRQVLSPASIQHQGSAPARSCMTCHNDKRAFGGDNFTSCQRCHKGSNFGF